MSKKPNLLVDVTFKDLFNENTVYGELTGRLEEGQLCSSQRHIPQQDETLRYCQLKGYTFHVHYTNTHLFMQDFPLLQEYFKVVPETGLQPGKTTYYCRLDFKVTPQMQEVIKCVTIPMQNELTCLKRIIVDRESTCDKLKLELEQQEVMWSNEKSQLQGKLDNLRSSRIVRLIEKFFI